MIDVVTFETAKRLKDAGFPQPEFAKYGMSTYDLYDNGRRHLYGSMADMKLFEHWIFAPSATDILPKLYTGVNDGTEWSIVFRGKNWSCVKRQWTERGQSVSAWYDAENPAEACAAAWLSIHEKTTT